MQCFVDLPTYFSKNIMKSIIESDNQRNRGNREFRNNAFTESLQYYKKVFIMNFKALIDASF